MRSRYARWCRVGTGSISRHAAPWSVHVDEHPSCCSLPVWRRVSNMFQIFAEGASPLRSLWTFRGLRAWTA